MLLIRHLVRSLPSRLTCQILHHFRSFFNLLLVTQVLHFKVHLSLVLRLGAAMNLLVLFHALLRVIVLH